MKYLSNKLWTLTLAMLQALDVAHRGKAMPAQLYGGQHRGLGQKGYQGG